MTLALLLLNVSEPLFQFDLSGTQILFEIISRRDKVGK